MGIGVRVEEYSGAVVEWLNGPVDVGALCSFVTTEPGLYPLLTGVDPYDDTCFNQRQTATWRQNSEPSPTEPRTSQRERRRWPSYGLPRCSKARPGAPITDGSCSSAIDSAEPHLAVTKAFDHPPRVPTGVNDALDPIRSGMVRKNLTDEPRDGVTSVRQLDRHAAFKLTEPPQLLISPVSRRL